MEERVGRLVVDLVEVLREVRAVRREVAEGRVEDASGDTGVLWVAVLGLVVGLGHLVQGWWGRRVGRHRGGEGGVDLAEVVTVGRTEEVTVVPAVSGEGDLERVEVVRVGGAVGEEGAEGRGGGRGGRGRGEDAPWWNCLLLSQK